MKILYVGKFEKSHRTQNYVIHSLEQLGHQVVKFNDREMNTDGQLLVRDYSTYDFVLFSKNRAKKLAKFIDYLKQQEVLTVCWQWDVYGIPERRKFPVEINCDLYLSSNPADASHHSNHSVLRQGIHNPESEMFFADEGEGFKYPVSFVGHNGRGFQPGRRSLVEFLKRTYGTNFHHFTTVRGFKLNEVLARSRVVVGDSYPLPGVKYWSNRVYEILGRGGFLLHPRTEGLEEEFEEGVHYVAYERGNYQQLFEMVNYYLKHDEEREAIRRAGFLHVNQNYTYTDRVKELIEIVSSRLSLPVAPPSVCSAEVRVEGEASVADKPLEAESEASEEVSPNMPEADLSSTPSEALGDDLS